MRRKESFVVDLGESARAASRPMDLEGRAEELARLREALCPGMRPDSYVTVVGAPGLGKRTLVRAALADVPHVWVAFSESMAPSLDPARWVADGARVVVLENVDRLAEGDLHRVATACASAGLVVLSTATRPSGLPAERLVRVGPLDASAGAAMLERLMRRHGGKVPSPEQLVELADRLHRHPAAITLAASRLCTLGAELLPREWLVRELAPGLDLLLRDLSEAEHRAVTALSALRESTPREVVLRIVSASSPDGASLLHALIWRSIVVLDGDENLALSPWLREHVLTAHTPLPEHEERALEALVHHAPPSGDALRAYAHTQRKNLEALLLANVRVETAADALAVARWAWFARFDLATGVEHTTRVIARAPRGSAPWIRASIIRIQFDYMRGEIVPPEELAALAAAARGLGQKELEGSVRVWSFYAQINDSTLDASLLAEQAAACEVEHGAVLNGYDRGRLHAFRGYLAARLCDLQSLMRHQRAAVELALRDGDRRLARDAWAQVAATAATSGEYREARHAIQEAAKLSTSDDEPLLNHIASEVVVLLGEKRLDRARQLVERSAKGRAASTVHHGLFWGTAGLVRFMHGERDEARACFERACATPDARPSLRSCWLLWLALLHAESGASLAAADTFDEAADLIRVEAELRDVMLDLEAVFAERIFGAEGARRRHAELCPSASVATLRAALEAGRAPMEARLALLGLGLDEVVPTLTLDAASGVFELGAVRGSFGAGSPQRAVLLALVDAHRRAPGVPASSDALIATAWPGEKLVGDSGANRLRVAVSRLRKAGLGEIIVGHPGGYALSHPLVLEEADVAGNDE